MSTATSTSRTSPRTTPADQPAIFRFRTTLEGLSYREVNLEPVEEPVARLPGHGSQRIQVVRVVQKVRSVIHARVGVHTAVPLGAGVGTVRHDHADARRTDGQHLRSGRVV